MAKAPVPVSKFERELVSGAIAPAMKSAEAKELTGLWYVPVGAINRIDGFNVRIATPAYEAHVEALAQSILANGFYKNKPLAGYVAKENDENVIYVTDGYSRLTATEIAIERGAEIEKLPIILKPQSDSMIDLTVALVQDNEGAPLTMFERAIVAKRLEGYGLSAGDIANRLSCTERYVGDLLVLSAATPKVRNLVIQGKVSATEAVKQLRKNPAKAGEKLTEAVEKAAAEGKTKASAKHVDDDGTGDDENKSIIVTQKTSKGKITDKMVFRLKGGEKVRKGAIEAILSVADGTWWREAEDLDNAEPDDVIITESIQISLSVTRAAAEGDSGDENQTGDDDQKDDSDNGDNGDDENEAGSEGEGETGL